jgi:hypothetical protein
VYFPFLIDIPISSFSSLLLTVACLSFFFLPIVMQLVYTISLLFFRLVVVEVAVRIGPRPLKMQMIARLSQRVGTTKLQDGGIICYSSISCIQTSSFAVAEANDRAAAAATSREGKGL